MIFERERKEHVLECSLAHPGGTLYLRPQYKRAKKNTVDVFPLAIGDIVRSIEVAPNDRVIHLHFRHIHLHCHLYSGQHANVTATNSGSIIVDMFGGNRNSIGEEYQSPQPHALPFLSMPTQTTLLKALASCDVLLGEHYARELCYRLSLNPDIAVQTFSEEEKQSILSQAIALRRECIEQGKGMIGTNGDGISLCSLIPLRDYSHAVQEYSSVNEAVRWRIISIMQERRSVHLRQSLLSHLEKNIRRFERAIEQMENDAAAQGRSLLYKRWAEVLISQPQVHANGLAEIELEDWEGHTHTIPLEPMLNLAQNAEKYFQKVRRANEAAVVRAQRLPQYKARLEELRGQRAALDTATTYKDLEAIQHTVGLVMKENETKEKQKSDPSKFRVFDVGEGYTLYVGRNAANNDELTMRFAKQNDIWLHARGSAGSHAVLRMNDMSKPPKAVLETAARITAYYSQARNAKYTPVIYTRRKYVRKPKGAAVGAVVVEREEVIMVEPKLPAGSSEE